MHAWAWLAIAATCAVIEVLNHSLVFASCPVGAIAAWLTSVLGGNTPIQFLILAGATVLSLRLKPIVLKVIFKNTPPLDTGINALIGLKAVTTSTVTDSAGTISLKNETWTARSEQGEIPDGAEVTVLRIDGAVAIVAPRVESGIN